MAKLAERVKDAMRKGDLAAVLLAVLLFGLLAMEFEGEAQPDDGRLGDFNGNGRVDSDDLFDFAYYFDLAQGDPLYETEGYRADFDHSGRVDEIDLFFFSSHWHKD